MATAAELVSKDRLATLQEAYWNSISRPLLLLGRTADARRALTDALGALGNSASYDDQLTVLDLRLLWGQLEAKEGKSEDARHTMEAAIQSGETLRAGHPHDLKPLFLVSNLYRELAAVTAGAQRREALLKSASAWHSWPATSYTARQEQSDHGAAER